MMKIMNLYFLMFWTIMLMIFIMTIFNSNPMYILLMLIFYSLMISINLSSWKKNSIYSIITFLIMISGILILFLYFSSLISNEQISTNLKHSYMLLIFMFIILLIHWLPNNLSSFYMQYPNLFYEVYPNFYLNNNSYNNISIILKYPFYFFSIQCMMFLLITLMSIIKMCSSHSLPLRKISKYDKKLY